MNILVCGFMGSGKTTFVESFRHNQLGFESVDLDSAVAEELGLLPSDLGEWINKNGLENFRHREIFTLKKLLENSGQKIISLGGGTLEAPGFWELSGPNKLVFLNTPFETCFSRIKNDPNRPLTSLGEEGLRSLYQKRLPLYLKADLTLSESEIKELSGLAMLVHNL